MRSFLEVHQDGAEYHKQADSLCTDTARSGVSVPVESPPPLNLHGYVPSFSHHVGRSSPHYINPGLRGKYWSQLPYPGEAISNIGIVMRIPWSTAVLSALWHVPGTNAVIFSVEWSDANFNAAVRA